MPRRVGGLLAVYVVVVAIVVVHGLGLTIAAFVVNAYPSLGGLSEPVPWGYIVFYAIGNVLLTGYGVAVLRLIVAKSRRAVRHNAAWALLTIGCLLGWYLLGMKSLTGLFVDALPGLVGIAYLRYARRAHETLTRP